MTSSTHGNLYPRSGRGSSARTGLLTPLGWAILWPCLASFALSVGCGGVSGDRAGSSCTSAAECGDGQLCEGDVCVEATAEPVTAPEACAVLSCPGEAPCCRAMSATGAHDYETTVELVEEVAVSRGQVKATFAFTEAGQQGWVVFDLGVELDLARVGFSGRYDGVADRFLTLSANGSEGGGCVFAFELQPRPAPAGSPAPFVLGSEVPLVGDDFCFERGVPGRASELVFGIFAAQRGRASLTISEVKLTPDER